jgi:predicted PurR-regulated permease PerM
MRKDAMQRSDAQSHLFIKLCFYAIVTAVVVGSLMGFGLLFIPLLASVLLTFLLEPVVNYIETKGFGRMTVIVGLCVLAAIVLAVAAVVGVPLLVKEASTIQQELPEYKQLFHQLLDKATATLKARFPSADIPDLYALASERLASRPRFDFNKAVSYLANVFAVLAIVGIIPVITFLLLLDGHLVQKAFLQMVPNRYFEMFILLIHKIATSIQQFIRGQLIDAAALGIMTSIGMGAIGMPNFLLIGLIAGLGNLIPYLGPIIGFMPAMFVLFVSVGFSVVMLVKIVVVFVLVQFLEGTFVYPIAVGSSVNLHPLVVILGITVGGQVGGIVGMLIAIPLISVVKVTVEVLYSNLKSYSII